MVAADCGLGRLTTRSTELWRSAAAERLVAAAADCRGVGRRPVANAAGCRVVTVGCTSRRWRCTRRPDLSYGWGDALYNVAETSAQPTGAADCVGRHGRVCGQVSVAEGWRGEERLQ